MNVYDKANELARALNECEQYIEYKKVKESLTDENDKKIIEDFRKLQIEAYNEQMEKGYLSDEMKRKLQDLHVLASKNAKVNEYLMSEERFGIVWADIMKILSQAVDIK